MAQPVDPSHAAEVLWLGYDGLDVPFAAISALLAYQPAWDRRIAQSYGSVPGGMRAVVLLCDGRVLPARRALDELHARWTAWQAVSPDAPRASEDTSQTQTIDETTH